MARLLDKIKTSRTNFGSFLSVVVFLCVLATPCYSIRFLGDRETYARYPRWDACISASIAFEFRTTQKDGLLMYTDDNGKYDYLQVRDNLGRNCSSSDCY